MVLCRGHASARSIFDAMLDFWVDWQVVLLMMLTMSLHCLLVVAGFFRKHTSNPALHACVWVAFLTLDACAAYALGLMLASGCDFVFSIYAPLSLFHLGAADAINAFAPTDNDLWLRYGFKMVLEVFAAAYIVSRSSDCPNFTTTAVLLFVVGVFKYGERIYALHCGSQAQILAAARPVYKYMSLTTKNSELSLLVSGDKEWYDLYNKESEKNELERPIETVTYEDIKQCNSLLKLMGPGIIEQVCLAYALCKIFRRRLTNLRIHQKNEDFETMRKLFLYTLKGDQIRKVIDLELSFIFDGVFSKASEGTWYQGKGVVTRICSLILLFAAATELIRLDKSHMPCSEKTSIPFAAGLANMLVFVALLVECLQLRKIVRSNWFRVWLACNYITEGRLANMDGPFITRSRSNAQNSVDGVKKPRNEKRWKRLHAFNLRAITWVFRYVGRPNASHWNFKLGQLSILVDSLNLVWWHYLMQLEFEKLCEAQSFQLEITNLCTEVNVEKLQDQLVEKILKRSNELVSFRDICHLRSEITQRIPHISFDQVGGLEDVVLKCHLLTCLLELDILKGGTSVKLNGEKNVTMSIGLSRYCLHLMLRRPKLMPEDPDVAKVLYTSLKQKLKSLYLRNYDRHTGWNDGDGDAGVEDNLNVFGFTKQAVSGMADDLEKWKLLAEVWLDILIYIVNTAENAYPHTEQMAKGGELVTHFWVLLGHLGPRQGSTMDTSCA